MKKLFQLLGLLLVSTAALAQTAVTVSGKVFDGGGNAATSGYVEFDIQPQSSGIQYFVPGIGTIAPQTVQCGLDGSGNVKALANLSNPCLVWGDDVVMPGNTNYCVVFAPGGLVTNTVCNELITGTTYNLNNPKFTPSVSLTPQHSFIGATSLSGNIIPVAPNVFNLGSSLNPFANIFASAITGINSFQSNSLTVLGLASLNGGGSMQGLWTAGPSSPITSCTESGNIATCPITNTLACSAITGGLQSIVITGTSVSGYSQGPTGQVGFATTAACSGLNVSYFNPTSGLGASTGGTLTVSPIFSQGLTHTGPESISGQLTETNYNGNQFAGPGPTPTIDQAVAACGTNVCHAFVTLGYTGPESVNLFTSSLGYSFYNGPNNISIHDYRSCNSSLSCPIYGIPYGGRAMGQRNRQAAMYYAHNETDSSTGITSILVADGTLPTNGGLMAGNINVAILHDSVTLGTSVSELDAVDGEAHIDATSIDKPLLSAFSFGGAVIASRANAAMDVINASVYRAKGSSNIGTGVIHKSYGLNADIQSGATAQSGTIATSPTGATEVGTTATITMTPASACKFSQGEQITIAGVGVAGYNSASSPSLQWTVASNCSAGAFTFVAASSGLAASGSGTVTTIPDNYSAYFQGEILLNGGHFIDGIDGNNARRHIFQLDTPSNFLRFIPFVDANGWIYQTRAGASLVTISSAGEGFQNNLFSLTPGAAGLGLGSNPFGFLTIGLGAANGYLINPLTAAATRQININDTNGVATVSLPLLGSAGTAGIQSQRFGASCTTAAAANATCTSVFSWTTSFNNANYTPVCLGEGPTGSPILTLSITQIAASITVQVQNAASVASSFAGVYCHAIHD